MGRTAFDSADEARVCVDQNLTGEPIELPTIQHAFTHFDLTITPWLVRCSGLSAVMDAPTAFGTTPGSRQHRPAGAREKPVGTHR